MLQNLELPILDMPSMDEITKGKTKLMHLGQYQLRTFGKWFKLKWFNEISY